MFRLSPTDLRSAYRSLRFQLERIGAVIIAGSPGTAINRAGHTALHPATVRDIGQNMFNRVHPVAALLAIPRALLAALVVLRAEREDLRDAHPDMAAAHIPRDVSVLERLMLFHRTSPDTTTQQMPFLFLTWLRKPHELI